MSTLGRSWVGRCMAAVLATSLALFFASLSTAGDAPPAAPPRAAPHAPFGIWYAPGAPDDSDALNRLLGVGEAEVARTFGSFEEWAASDCDLLVLRGTDRSGIFTHRAGTFSDVHKFDGLKGKRVLGIGWESQRAFEELGLELHNSATFERESDSVVFQPNVLGGSTESRPMEAFSADLFVGGKAKWTNEALHMPRWGALATKVEAVARRAVEDDYAFLARQQNYVYCGIAADIRTWTEPFRDAVRALASALRARPVEPFALAEWDVTAPGAFEFTLSRTNGSQYEKQFFFRFDKPTLFSADLTQEGSSDTMLFFMAQKSQAGRDMERLDGKSGETLRILIPITTECIRANGGRYWTLRVDNFSRSSAKCTLRIGYANDASVRFHDGLAIPMANPPSDEKTIRALIERFRSDDPETRVLANAALLIVGRPAVPLLEAAKPESKERDERVRISMLVSRIKGE